MAQKKKTDKKSFSWLIVVIVALLVTAGFHFAPNETKKLIHNAYLTLTEITEMTEFPSGETEEEVDVSKRNGTLEVYYWDVGQADCILLSCDKEYMLIDAGNNADGQYIVAQLQKMGITKLQYLVGTHPHEDHIGGMDDIVRNFAIGKVYMPKRESLSKTFEDVVTAIAEKKGKITIPRKGMTFSLGDATCKIVSVASDAEDTNDASIVIQVTYGNHVFLFTGDLTSVMEAEIAWEDVDVLKVAHHGSRYSSSEKFLAQVKPELAIISAGNENDYGHPHEETLARLKQIKAKVYCTNQKGTIKVVSDGEELSVKALNIHLDGNRRDVT